MNSATVFPAVDGPHCTRKVCQAKTTLAQHVRQVIEPRRRRSIRTALAALLALLCMCTVVRAAGELDLVRDGTAQAIVLHGEEDADSAQLLTDTVRESTGATLPMQAAAPADFAGVIIHVGRTDYVEQRLTELGIAGLDQDGFVIVFPEPNTIVIAGPLLEGTLHGVCEFLERFLGVRWLFPGELGTHVPRHRSLAIPTEAIRQEPAFLMRFIYWSQRQSETNTRERILERRAWRARLRCATTHKRISFNHFIFQIIRPTEFGKTNPEFFPILKGKRTIPETDTPHHWEPCFTAPGLVEASVQSLSRYFEKHPERTTVSLAVNDNGGHCECERCLEMDGNERNEFNYPNRSRSYFTWANAVAEGLIEKHPGKLLGCLAYREVSTPPPDMKLHPAIVPFICKDLYVWIDPEMEAEGHALTRRWGEAATEIAWWDYPWGNTYVIPRIWFRKMADIYRFLHANKVRHIFSEADVTEWIEGPKFYLLARLTWDPYQDIEPILQDWYEGAVGKTAAPFLAKYFEFWDEYWCERMPSSRWFSQTKRRVYQPPEPPDGYIRHLDVRELGQCEEWLKQAVAAAETDIQKDRAELFLAQFRESRKLIEPQLVSANRLTRLLDLERLTGERLAFAVDNYLQWQAIHPADSHTDALKLTAALMLERAGRQGAWAEAFDASPWSDSKSRWLLDFVRSPAPLANSAKEVKALGTATPPRIDGMLDDPCWKDAQRVSDYRHFMHKSPLSQPALAAFRHDRDKLYVAFSCLELAPDKIVGKVHENNGPMWEDDSVEFFIAPDPVAGPETYRQLIISVTGAVYDARNGKTAAWAPDIQVKTHIGDRFWTAELAIPLAALSAAPVGPGSTLRINVNRSRQVKDLPEIGGWQFVDGANKNVSTFARLVFE